MNNTKPSKDQILKQLLMNSLGKSTAMIEKSTSEQMKSGEYISKHFAMLNRNIKALHQNYQTTKLKREKELKDKEERLKARNNILKRCKTNPAFYSIKNSSIKTGTMRLSQTKSTINIKAKAHINPLTRSHQLSKSSFYNNTFTNEITLTEPKVKERNKMKLKPIQLLYESAPKKKAKVTYSLQNSQRLNPKPINIKDEGLSIQNQINQVTNSIVNTEKALENKKSVPNFQQTNMTGNVNFNLNITTSQIIKINSKDKSLRNIDIIRCISIFLSENDRLQLFSLTKESLNQYHKNYIFARINNKIQVINNKLEEYKTNLSDYSTEMKSDFTKFSLSKSSAKAITLLNDPLYIEIFRNKDFACSSKVEEVAYIYRGLHGLLKNEEISKIKDNKLFWEKNCAFLLEKGEKQMGDFVLMLTDKFVFDKDNYIQCNQVVEKAKGKIDGIKCKEICSTSCGFLFILKNVLEYFGILINKQNTQHRRIYEGLNYLKEHYQGRLKEFYNINNDN